MTVFPVQAMKACSRGKGIAPVILNLVQADGGEWLTPRPGRFISWKEHRYSTNRTLSGPHSWSGSFGEDKICFLYRDSNPGPSSPHSGIALLTPLLRIPLLLLLLLLL